MKAHRDTPAVPGRRRLHLKWAELPKQAVVLLAAIVILLPLYFLLITPLKTLEGYSLSKLGFPNPIVFDNFVTALRGGQFFLWFGNSIIFVAGAVVLSTIVSTLAAFAMARMKFQGHNLMLSISNALMVLPPVVMIIPMFLFLSKLHLTSTYPAVVLVYAGLVTPFSIYMLTNFFRTVPHEILESALIDGASSLEILVKILLPLSAPALMTMIVVNAMWVWNDLLIALVLLPDDTKRTLMVGITLFSGRYDSDVPVSMAGLLMASIPMLLLYIFGQRYFTRGLVAGAVKG